MVNPDLVRIVRKRFEKFLVNVPGFRLAAQREREITVSFLALVKRQPESNFLTLLYPYLPGMEQPQLSRQADGAVLAWKNATDTVRITAHTLKGSIRHFGETRACDQAAEMEDLAQAGRLKEAAEALATLNAEVGRLVNTLRSWLRPPAGTRNA